MTAADLDFFTQALKALAGLPVTNRQPATAFPVPKLAAFDIPAPLPRVAQATAASESSPAVVVRCKLLKPATSISIDATALTPVADVRHKVARQLQVAEPADIRLLARGKALLDGKLVGDYPALFDADAPLVTIMLKAGVIPFSSPAVTEEPQPAEERSEISDHAKAMLESDKLWSRLASVLRSEIADERDRQLILSSFRASVANHSVDID